MNEKILHLGSLGGLCSNLVLGLLTSDHINLIVAISGAAVSVFANLDRMAYYTMRIIQLIRRGGRLPEQPTDETAPADNPNPENQKDTTNTGNNEN